MKNNIENTLTELLKNKSVLIIEGDNGLYHTVGIFEDFCVEQKIKYHTILNASEMSLKGIIELVNFHEVIVWESQYVTETSDAIMDALFDDSVTTPQGLGGSIDKYPQNRKILLECYISDPYMWYKPKGLKKRLLGLSGDKKDVIKELYEFGDDHKPIWEKGDDEL